MDRAEEESSGNEIVSTPWRTDWRRVARRLAVVMALIVAVLVWTTRAPANPEQQEGAVLPGGVKVVYSPGFRVGLYGLERLHPFDTHKYDKIARRLVRNDWVPDGGFEVPRPATREQLETVHPPVYLDGLGEVAMVSSVVEVNIPSFIGAAAIDERVVYPFRLATGGTIAALSAALEHGTGINIGGGFHHAKPEGGHGFCMFNDTAVALNEARAAGFRGRVLIVDTDAHQGDGNHAAFHKDSTVYTLSLHQKKIFPQPRVAGDRDIELSSGTDDSSYLSILTEALEAAYLESDPQLVVHIAGSDVLNDDPLATMALTRSGLVERDLIVARSAWDRNLPYVHLLAGGYGPTSALAQGDSIEALLEAAADLRRQRAHPP